MRFGPIPVAEASGAILAHSQRVGERRLKKGRRLDADDVAALVAAGRETVIAAVLEDGDLHEDEAAGRIAAALAAGGGLEVGPAFTGRANLYATADGLLAYAAERLAQLNGLAEAITVAALPPYERVAPKQMVATVKIIPFAARAADVSAAEAAAGPDVPGVDGAPLMRVAPFTAKRAALIQTHLPGTKPGVLDKTVGVTRTRMESLGGELVRETRCAHDAQSLRAELVTAAPAADLVIVVGASAIVDRADVVPAAVDAAGGTVHRHGMPVDPGNLLLLGEIDGTPVVAGPSSVRSPRPSGFDWVLARLCADLAVTDADIAAMGAGGLLKEIPSRPQPRAAETAQASETGADPDEAAETPPPAPRIAGLLLAAGSSRRMGAVNKLTADVAGRPMVAHAAAALAGSGIAGLTVVTGHEAEAVTAALGDVAATVVHNPDFAEGLSTSLRRGIAALPDDVDGVVVGLGDMPGLTPAVIDRLIAAFDPAAGAAICVPTHAGRRGNPVLFARRFFAEMQELSGDVGARPIVAGYADQVREVPVDDDAIHRDVDDPAALAALGGG